MSKLNEIYADYNATAPILQEVQSCVNQVLKEKGNPSSLHAEGRKARAFIEDARESVAQLLDVDSSEIIFTSGGTEADNWAVQMPFLNGDFGKIVASSIEHAAIEKTLAFLEEKGCEVQRISPNINGEVQVQDFLSAIENDTTLATLMLANNETGVLQSVGEVGKTIAGHKTIFHCDAVQALGRIPVHPWELGVNLLSVSAHKIGALKGTGALWVHPELRARALIHGGGQERGVRPGTENLIGIVAFGEACRVVSNSFEKDVKYIQSLRNELEHKICEKIPSAKIYAANSNRLCNTTNVLLPGCTADLVLMSLDMQGICASAGSACSSGALEPSRILISSGMSREDADCSIRLSLGKENTSADVEQISTVLSSIYNRIQCS